MASRCFGSVAKGRLENGRRLPRSGKNFAAYSSLGWLLGRTFVHDKVHELVLGAYRALETSLPGRTFVYGETGWASGGSFKPHRTHQNGLSVDFMVPVKDAAGAPAQLPSSVFNQFGYGLEFDDTGRSGELSIDFEAIVAHLQRLDEGSRSSGLRISKVIFDPTLRRRLLRARGAEKVRQLPFSKTPAWVRHDEHYHVDFGLPCSPLSE